MRDPGSGGDDLPGWGRVRRSLRRAGRTQKRKWGACSEPGPREPPLLSSAPQAPLSPGNRSPGLRKRISTGGLGNPEMRRSPGGEDCSVPSFLFRSDGAGRKAARCEGNSSKPPITALTAAGPHRSPQVRNGETFTHKLQTQTRAPAATGPAPGQAAQEACHGLPLTEPLRAHHNA